MSPSAHKVLRVASGCSRGTTSFKRGRRDELKRCPCRAQPATEPTSHLLLGASLAFCLCSLGAACSDPKPLSAGAAGADKGLVSAPLSPKEKRSVSFEVSGVVLDRDGTPVSGAMVMQGGRPDERLLTDDAGRFRISLEDTGVGTPTVVAAKIGYRAVGEHLLSAPEGGVELRLHKVLGPDNVDYVYKDPGDGENVDLEDCTHCHQSMVQQFLTSKHAEATKNPLVQDLYAGVNRALSTQALCEAAGGRWMQGLEPGSAGRAIDKCYLGGGVLAELNTACGNAGQRACDDPAQPEASKPEHFGACADCHAPGIDGVAGGRNLHEAVGTAYDKGVHCDTCHKVADIDLSKPPGVGQRLVMGRPSEAGKNTFTWEPVYYGPIIDVPNPVMRGSYQPKFNEAEFCAGCHEQNQPALLPGQRLDEARWPEGLPIHSTFSEWQGGPYSESGMPCQGCHMPVDFDSLNSLPLFTDKQDESIVFGWERPGDDNRMHTFRGPLDGDPRLINDAVDLSITTRLTEGRVSARVQVTNVGAGHAMPTGEPMRSLLLLVEADSPSCATLSPRGGMTLDEVGGALATGVVGQGVELKGARMTWPEAAPHVRPGQHLRIVRPTGAFFDYAGIGFFADSARSAEDKGMPLRVPLGEAEVLSVKGSTITLKGAIPTSPGDIVYLGEAWSREPRDGAPSRHLAGASGVSFARVLVDKDGDAQVPHYRAIDMVRDNRIASGASAISEHVFSRGEGCDEGRVRATLLYRPHPLKLARRQGWDAKDYVIGTAEASWSLTQAVP